MIKEVYILHISININMNICHPSFLNIGATDAHLRFQTCICTKNKVTYLDRNPFVKFYLNSIILLKIA